MTILVGFVHDFAAGIWAACALAVWLAERGMAEVTSREAAIQLAAIQRAFFFLALACVAVVMLAGVGRTFTYVPGVYGEADEGLRRRMLAIKHALLLFVFGAGTWWQYLMTFG